MKKNREKKKITIDSKNGVTWERNIPKKELKKLPIPKS